MLNFTPNKVEGSYFIECDVHYDDRGTFQEVFHDNKYGPLNLSFDHAWRQANRSYSKERVLRGIHVAPYNKLVQCVKGRIFDVVVDLREGSPTYLQWDGIWLSGDLCNQLYVPSECGHAFYAYEDSMVLYLQGLVTNAIPILEYGIHWNDPMIDIKWPLKCEASELILSDKDRNAKCLI